MKVEVMKNILGENDKIAEENRQLFKEKGVFVINLMGSPGSGKTSLLELTIANLKDKLKMAVIEGDLFTAKDAERIERHDVPVIQINTAGGCHLDAAMVKRAAESLDLDALDLIIVENVGNLVCPAEFDVGENIKAVVLSITEGDDKPLKYPLIFKESAVAILNKTDILKFTNFSMESARRDLETIHPDIQIIEVSCMTGDGLDNWYGYLLDSIE